MAIGTTSPTDVSLFPQFSHSVHSCLVHCTLITDSPARWKPGSSSISSSAHHVADSHSPESHSGPQHTCCFGSLPHVGRIGRQSFIPSSILHHDTSHDRRFVRPWSIGSITVYGHVTIWRTVSGPGSYRALHHNPHINIDPGSRPLSSRLGFKSHADSV